MRATESDGTAMRRLERSCPPLEIAVLESDGRIEVTDRDQRFAYELHYRGAGGRYGGLGWVELAPIPGSTKLPDDSPLSIRTLRRTGSLALSARREHTQVGEAVALDPTHDDSAFSGTLPVLVLGAPNTAYLVRTGEDENAALIDTGDVTLIPSGNFTKAQLPTLASALEEAQ